MQSIIVLYILDRENHIWTGEYLTGFVMIDIGLTTDSSIITASTDSHYIKTIMFIIDISNIVLINYWCITHDYVVGIKVNRVIAKSYRCSVHLIRLYD